MVVNHQCILPSTRSIYYLFVTGAVLGIVSGCSSDVDPAVNCTTDGPAINVVSVQETSCGESDGVIEVQGVGGEGEHQFRINSNSFQSQTTFNNLAAGTYTVTVRDGNGCERSATATVTNSDGVNLTALSTDSGCESSEGSISAEGIGGEEPFMFQLDDAEFQSSPMFTGLSAGVYTIRIRDATGCEASESVHVASGVSLEGDIRPIINESCAILDCHNGNQFPDFREKENILENASMIKQLTGDGTMPQEGSLTQSQIDQIACWVDDGALDN